MSSVDDIFAAWEYLQHTLSKLGEAWDGRRTEFLSGTGTYKWTGLVPDLKTLVQGSLLWMADGSIAWIRTTEGVKSSKLRVCTLANPQGTLRSIEELSSGWQPQRCGHVRRWGVGGCRRPRGTCGRRQDGWASR